MKTKMVFFGSSKFVIPILEVLRKNFDLKLVLTTERLALPGEALEAPMIKYCVENKIPYVSVSSLSDPKVKSQLLNVNCQLAVLADFGLIIPEQVLDLFPKGIINIHPSLLPKYRGPTPVQTAILNGDKITGVTIIKLDDQVDHGPMLGQEKEEILPTDTTESLYKRLFENGANLLLKVLNKDIEGILNPTPQNHKNSTFTNHLTRQDGFINFNNPPSPEKLQRMIKAYYPWPGTWTKLRIGNHELRIKFLPDKKIQVSGKKPMSYKDFANGYPELKQQLGKLLEQLV